jgi:NAD(P)-dependent dehydrogenase (short-subunit alcohol dehydrogenase family)
MRGGSAHSDPARWRADAMLSPTALIVPALHICFGAGSLHHYPVYSVAKAGLVMLTKLLAHE